MSDRPRAPWFHALALAGAYLAAASIAQAADPAGQIFARTAAGGATPYPYLAYLPASYYENPARRFPLVICLGGTGQRGNGSYDGTLVEKSGTNELPRVLHAGPLRLVNSGSPYFSENPTIVAHPQCLSTSTWTNATAVNATISQLVAAHRVDPERIYVTGFSLGGGGTWTYGANFGSRLAALVPIAGAAYPSTGYLYGNMNALNIWAVHCANDGTVPAAWTTGMQTGYAGTFLAGWSGGIAKTIAAITPSSIALDSHPDRPTANSSGSLAGVVSTYTGHYRPGSGWSWVGGMNFTGGDRLQMTLFNGGGHSGWDQTYGGSSATLNRPFWNWLLAQGRGQTAVGSSSTEIILDDGASTGITRTGTWTNASGAADDYADGFSTGGTDATLTFTPNLPRDGIYRAYIWYPAGPDRSASVPVTIEVGGATTTLLLDLRQGGGQWIPLGSYDCLAGGATSVTISTTGTAGAVVADAIRFIESPGSSANTPPAVSSLADLTLPTGSAGTVNFNLADFESGTGGVTLAVASSATTVVPATGLVLGGSGAARTLTVTPSTVGTADIHLIVTDSGGLAATRRFTVTATAPSGNTAPSITPIANQTLVQGVGSGSLPFTIGDAEGGTLTVTVEADDSSLLPSGSFALAGSGSSRSLAITPPGGVTGITNVTLRVTDGGGLSATSAFTVTVQSSVPTNTAPSISVIAGQTVIAGAASTAIPFTVGDAEGGPLVTTATAANATLLPGASFAFSGSGTSRTLIITAPAGSIGSTNVTVRVRDNGNLTGSTTFSVTVNAPPPPNTAPTITAVDNQTVTAGSASAAIPFTLGDAEGGTLIVTATAANGGLLPSGSFTLNGTGASRTLTITAPADAVGSTTVTLTVTDDGALTASTTFPVTINAAPPNNTAPTITTVANQAVVAGTPSSAIPFTVADVDGGALSVTASAVNPLLLPAGSFAFNGSGESRTLVITAPLASSGSTSVTIQVRDSGDLAASTTFTVTVNAPPPPNSAPTISSIANQAVTAGTASTAIPFTVGDAEGGTLATTATAANTTLLPGASFAFSGSGASRTLTITAPSGSSGSTNVTVRVRDNGNLTSSTTFSVTISAPPPANTAPTITTIDNQAVTAGIASATIPFSLADAEGGTLIAAAIAANAALLPPGALVVAGSGSNRTLTITAPADAVGTANVTVTVTDDGGLTASTTFTVTINAAPPTNTAPTITAIDNQAVTAGIASTAIPFSVGDAESGTLTAAAIANAPALLPPGTLVVAGSGANRTLTITAPADAVGTTNVTVTVTDDGGLIASTTFSVTINVPPPTNTAPTITAIDNQAVTAGVASAAIPFSLTDAEGGILTAAAVAVSATLLPPETLVVAGSGSNRTLTITAPADAVGATNVTVTITDDGGLIASTTFSVTINVPPPTNTAPTITAIANQAVTAGVASAAIPFTLADAEGGTLTATAVAANQTLLPLSALVVAGSGANRTLTITAPGAAPDTTSVTVTVTDDGGLIASTTFSVTINAAPPANTAPAITTIANQTVTAGIPSTAIPFSLADAEGGVLSVSASTTDATLLPAGSLIVSGSGLSRDLTISAPFGTTGTTSVTVTVTDDGGLTASTTFAVSIGVPPPTNTAPTITAIDNQVVTAGTPSAAIPFSVADAEGGTLTATATAANQTLLPISALVVTGSGANRTLTITAPGTAPDTTSVTVTVTDNGALIASTSFTVTINAPVATNTAPTITAIDNQIVTAGTPSAAIPFSVADAEGGTLTATATAADATLLPAGALVVTGSGANRTLTITAPAAAVGSSNVTVKVTDNGGLTASTTFAVVVNAAPPTNTAPTITSIANLSVEAGLPSEPITFTVTDAQGDPLTLTAVALNSALLPEDAFSFSGTGSERFLVITAPATSSGSTTVTVVVFDDGGLSASTTFQVVVTGDSPSPSQADSGESGGVACGAGSGIGLILTLAFAALRFRSRRA